MMQRQRHTNQSGFTIVELLFATAVFTVIVISITIAIMRFSNQYYKGVISTTTQNTARTIIDDVARAIEFNPGSVYELGTPGGDQGYCIGTNKRYSFRIGQQVTESPEQHSLITDSVPCTGIGVPPLPMTSSTVMATAGPNARDLLGTRMRLADFSVKQFDTGAGGSGIYYVIKVRLVYGDDDVLDATKTKCNFDVGMRFCAVSELSTVVQKRISSQ